MSLERLSEPSIHRLCSGQVILDLASAVKVFTSVVNARQINAYSSQKTLSSILILGERVCSHTCT